MFCYRLKCSTLKSRVLGAPPRFTRSKICECDKVSVRDICLYMVSLPAIRTGAVTPIEDQR
uniref:Uncharacterized protein n=1 Tax=Helianthus annuus TaxID=4232 RepID=A0A251SNW9_HELAN